MKINHFTFKSIFLLAAYCFLSVNFANACGENVSYGGEFYPTVQIGDQCWMTKNINIGTRIDGVSDQADNSIIEKYCYDDSDVNCTTYGGLYQWDEMMQYTTTEGAQGICPTDWHIPTDAEQHTLEDYYATGVCDPNRNDVWDCDPAGTALKDGLFSGLAGYSISGGTFVTLDILGRFWSSSEFGTNAWERLLVSSLATVNRHAFSKSYGLSVRCIQNEIITHALTYTPGSNGSITGTSPQTINHGSDGTAVIAVPSANYHFVDWSDSSTDNPRTDTNVTGDITVTVNFAIDQYTVTFEDHDTTELKVETVDHGEDVTAPADPTRAGYTFNGWDLGLSGITSDLIITADYERCTSSIGNTIWLDINPNGFQEIGEPGLENIRVKLLNNKEEVVERTDTNHNGHYKFEDLCKGEYKVIVKEEDIPTLVYKQTYDPTGSVMNNKATVEIERDRNDNHTKADFGFTFNLPL